MANNKRTSQADKAVSDARRKAPTGTKGTPPAKQPAGKQAPQENKVPVRLITSVVCISLFVLFLVMGINPEGALLKVINSFVLGLIGKTGFYISIPALLYLFIIQAFSGNKPVKMRSICLIVFVFLCGCVSHLSMDDGRLTGGMGVLAELYTGGSEGYTGGLLCGGVAMILRWACGSAISFIALAIGIILTLLASMQITIPSLIRAVKNRPRPEWDDEDLVEEKPEPAALVVNHIATKHIEHTQKRRQRMAMIQEEAPAKPAAQSVKPQLLEAERKITPKANDMMSQIDGEIGTPVAAAAEPVEEEVVAPEAVFEVVASAVPVQQEVYSEVIPQAMPEFVPDESLPAAPKTQPVVVKPVPKPGKVTAKEASESAQIVAQEIAQNQASEKPAYCFPPIDLLNRPTRGGVGGTEEMRENTKRLNETLASFKIDAHIINVTRGPSVTRYEVELDKGVRLNKLTSSADDIALSLGASGVRIAAIPGKISVVGIEVPNRNVTTVSIREVIDSPEFTKSKSKSTFAVGKDIGGTCIVGNIAKMPHMLIAGTTGSGKSVCMNSIIISLLYKASPDDVKLIMVDPKMVELGIYNGIPHLLIPVVTDPKKAAGALQWAVTEMMRRYKSMSDAGVRDLESYNSIIEGQETDGERLPQVVVIIDELADLMLVAAKEVEDSICRIAQMGRAAGIHLVIATQRPSADVITGLMKANIPSRIAFAVASAMESRIILDTQGAEKLVGRGDMLFSPQGNGKPMRVQGCFVADSEVEAVASYVKDHFIADYNQQVMEEIEKKASQTGKKTATEEVTANDAELDGDEMLPAAVDVILETGQASVSMLQRRLKLGYARAARIVDEMEEKGIVGPFQGSKPRAILITKEQWHVMQQGQSQQMAFDDLAESATDIPDDIN